MSWVRSDFDTVAANMPLLNSALNPEAEKHIISFWPDFRNWRSWQQEGEESGKFCSKVLKNSLALAYGFLIDNIMTLVYSKTHVNTVCQYLIVQRGSVTKWRDLWIAPHEHGLRECLFLDQDKKRPYLLAPHILELSQVAEV